MPLKLHIIYTARPKTFLQLDVCIVQKFIRKCSHFIVICLERQICEINKIWKIHVNIKIVSVPHELNVFFTPEAFIVWGAP